MPSDRRDPNRRPDNGVDEASEGSFPGVTRRPAPASPDREAGHHTDVTRKRVPKVPQPATATPRRRRISGRTRNARRRNTNKRAS